ncbi:FixH family protein [uncultured Roseobacter sp.]|uniref:FixH family protein n=1 Tax=uncultured Roseobacter sp. TaxID=114847 RepID=UPI002635FE51|nr:FixH family protein [uncultured Roseobacter sp.]
MTRELTGRHVAIIFCAAFTVIIAVNLTLAFSAVKTFPGLEVRNSYVASQTFDADRAAQQSLGWTVRADAFGDEVVLSIRDANGDPVEVTMIKAELGRATHVRDDQHPDFTFNGEAYVARARLAPGNWNIRMVAQDAAGTEFRQRVVLHVAGQKS